MQGSPCCPFTVWTTTSICKFLSVSPPSVCWCLHVGNHIAGSEYCDHSGVMLDCHARPARLNTQPLLQTLWLFWREYHRDWTISMAIILCGDYYFYYSLLFLLLVVSVIILITHLKQVSAKCFKCFRWIKASLYDFKQSYKQHTVCLSWLDTVKTSRSNGQLFRICDSWLLTNITQYILNVWFIVGS